MDPATGGTPRAGGDGGRCVSDTRCCRVPGCAEPLPPGYHTKYRICRHHCQLASQEVDGKTVRFCQQCGRFQGLDEFDSTRRSCRASLSQHKMRRHLAKQQHAEDERRGGGAAPADEGAAQGNGKRRRQPAAEQEEPQPSEEQEDEQPPPRQKAAPQPHQPQPPPVLPAELPCDVYVAPLQPPQPLPQPPPGHWASSVQPPAQQFGLMPAAPSHASEVLACQAAIAAELAQRSPSESKPDAPAALPSAWWCLATASHTSGSARVLLQPVAPAVPGAAGTGPPAGPGPSLSPAHQAALGPGMRMLPVPAPRANPQAVNAAMSIMMETSPSLEVMLAFDADLGLELGPHWGLTPSDTCNQPAAQLSAPQQPQPQQQPPQQPHQQQEAGGLQLPSPWSLAGPQAAPAQAEQPCQWELAGSSGACREVAAATSPCHPCGTATSANQTSAAQLQAVWNFAAAGTQAGEAQLSSALPLPPAPAGTAAPHNPGPARAQRRRSPRTGAAPGGRAVLPPQQAPASPAAPTGSVGTHYGAAVPQCPACMLPDMRFPPGAHPDDGLYLQQLGGPMLAGTPPPERCQCNASVLTESG